MNWMSRKDKQINFKRKFSELNKIDNFKNMAQKENVLHLRDNNFPIKSRDIPSEKLENRNYNKVISKINFYIY
jgi:hypothetical protein